MNSNFKLVLVAFAILLIIDTSIAGRYYERHRERGILGLGLDLLGVRPAYGYGNGYGGGYGGYGGGHRPVVHTSSYYGYPAYGNGYGNQGYGNQGYGYLDNAGYGHGGYGHGGYGHDGYGHGRAPIRVKTVIKSKHDW